MKFKKNWKRFFTLDRHHAEGFTLVELIVVIAILAILAGVAVPAYSGYVSQANKQADITLASEVKNALMLGYYNNTLEPGASVVVYFDDDKAVAVDPDGNDLGADAAMKAAFGEGYTSLDLKWDGWKDQMGVAADATMMGYVNDSNFKSENLGDMLGQVQTVVDAASNFFVGGSVEKDSALDNYLTQAGVPHDTITEENAAAVGNALVFVTANELSKTNLSETATHDEFWFAWQLNDFEFMNWEAPSKKAASYAMTLALATYVDAQAGTDYCSQLGGGPSEILGNQASVYNAITSASGNKVAEAYAAYTAGDTSSMMYKDAMAFMGYMQGVTTAADSLLGKTDIYQSNYFNDGTVLNYVNDYMSISDVLMAVDAANGALVFHFNGESVSCLPLDY